jgi:hypothetical protein
VAESLSSNLVSDDTLRAWLNGAEENIESGVATDMVAVCPLALRRACRELIERRSRVETPREPMSRLIGDLDWCLTQINPQHKVHEVVTRVTRSLAEFTVKTNDDPHSDLPVELNP